MIPRPMPRAPPVTMTTLPSKSRVVASAGVLGPVLLTARKARRNGTFATLRPVIRTEIRDHVAEVVIDNPPVNALPVAGWYELADAIRSLGRDPEVRALIVAANPDIKGYQAGVDIKELAADPTNASLIGVNRGCWETFAAVYDCEVPVIAAVHGYCLGGGVGIAGNADIIVASDDATFGLPEVDRGALGVATHLARLVPIHKMRAMYFTSSMITSQQLHEWGTVEKVVPRAELMDAAREIGQVIAGKSPLVIRRAKESINGIDPVDVKKSYRYEQGFTYELNLWGDSDELREAFVEKRDADLRGGELLGGTEGVAMSKPRVPVIEGYFTEDGRREAARRTLPELRRLLLPEAVLVLPQPRVRRHRPRRRRAVDPGHAVVVHRQPLRPAAALPGRATRSSPTASPPWSSRSSRWSCSGRSPRASTSERSTAGQEMELVVEPLYESDDAVHTVWKWRPVCVSERGRHPGRGHAPVGQVGQELRRVRRGRRRAALADAGLAWGDVGFLAAGNTMRNGYPGYVSGSTFAQALGWRGVRVSSSLRGVRVGCGRDRPGPGPDPGRSLRRRAGRRRRHRAEGLLRPAAG